MANRLQRTDIAASDVDQAKAELDQARLDVRVKVRKAFNDLLRVEDEIRVHDDHIVVSRQAIDAARIKYTVGKVPQQDMLKAQVTMTRLAEHMVLVDQDADLARGRLNTLLTGRDPAAPLSVMGEHPVMTELPSLQALEDLAVHSRPDLAAAGIAAERSHKEEALAKMAYVPDFTVSAGYMVMPSGTNMRNDYMVEGTMNIPWLNHRKHDAEIAESKVKVTEQDAELNAMRREAFGQIQEALVETRSSQKLALMYEEQLRPQAWKLRCSQVPSPTRTEKRICLICSTARWRWWKLTRRVCRRWLILTLIWLTWNLLPARPSTNRCCQPRR